MIKNIILVIILSLVMGGAVLFGIMESGSPFETRSRKFDQERVSAITSFTYSFESYYDKHNKLPEKLTDLSTDTYTSRYLKDPETGNEYEYKIVSDTEYQICANFAHDSKKKNSSYERDFGYMEDKYDHPKGYHCFDLSVEPDDYDTNLPESITQDSGSGSSTDELTKRSRDASRLSDLANLQQAINVADQEASQSGVALCDGSNRYPCSGNSLVDKRSSDGTGWVKVNLNLQKSVSVPVLPIDPKNDGINHYTYCGTDAGWEIDAVLESSQQKDKMTNDGGNDPNRYEVGSNLTMINPSGTPCRY